MTNDEWLTVRLDDACSLITDGTHQTPTYAEEGFVFLSSKNVVSGKIDWENIKRIPEWLHTELHGRLSPQKGDLLLAKNGTTGVAAVVDRDVVFDIYVSLALLRPKPNVLPEYLHRALNSPLAKKQFNGALKGIGVPNLHLKDIRRAVIPLPPLAEQRRIADVLDRAEALRAKRRAALAQLDSLTQSLFLDLFGDPVTNPKGVKVVRLADVATRITDGVHQKPTYTESGVPFISVKDITTGKLIFDQCKFISAEDHQRFTKRCKPERLDILYTKVGATYGRPAIVESDREFSLYVSVCIIKPRKDLIDPHFLNAALGTSAVKNQADRRIKGIGVPDLHLDQIQSFLIPLPSMSQQREFTRRVTAVEKLKTAQRASLAELDSLFATLQHRAFRGEL